QALAPYDQVVVLSGDAPLITVQTIQKLKDFHAAQRASMTLLTARLQNPTGYGRIIRKSKTSAEVKAIIEQKKLSKAQEKIGEINAGFYAFAVNPLYQNINKISTDNPHGEFYLTDMAEIFVKAKAKVVAVEAAEANEVLGGNTRADLVEIDQHIRS